jgi:hypothetical protein
MLTRTGFELLEVAIAVVILIPLFAITFVVGRHLVSPGMDWLFALLLVVLVTLAVTTVRIARSGTHT